jgi:murein DD-endopeptidase MepM/ murein hydrolase activator NlpD
MRRNNPYRSYGRRRGGGWLIWLAIALLSIGMGLWALTQFLPQFERIAPSIVVPQKVYWGSESPLQVMLKDNRALAEYEAVVTDGKENVVVASNRFAIPVREINITLAIPKKLEKKIQQGGWHLLIQARDTSLWNRVVDNSAVASVEIIADKQPPVITLLAKGETIARGGSALVVFAAEDPNLKMVYIEAGGERFIPNIYRHKPYYATLIAWPFRQKHLNATIVAQDRAGNTSTQKLSFAVVNKHYKTSWIRASDRFINGRITEVAHTDPRFAQIADPLERFRAVNETMRLSNEKRIHELARSALTTDPITAWSVRPFYPLKGAKLVADFGDERHYYYGDSKHEVSRSYHVGYDLASVRHAPIISSNDGTVLFAGHNGIYGKMPLIDHGFGLTTLYGHCSHILVHQGDIIDAGKMIARTGKTGLALGDHLHFGILVHGIEVWPMDWMKRNWIRKNIDDVFKKADKIIAKHTQNTRP